jgi:hypothetical protein
MTTTGSTNTNIPSGIPIAGPGGVITMPWYQFFVTLFNRTGNAIGSISTQLDTISSAVGSILYRGVTAWDGLAPGSIGQLLQMGATVPEWATFNPANLGSAAANTFLAAPSTGVGLSAFRLITTPDLDNLAGQYPGEITGSPAAAGNIGEVISKSVAIASAVALVSGVAKDVTSISLTPGDWDVWGNIATNAAVTSANGWINIASATDPIAPNGGAYASWGSPVQIMPVGMMQITVTTTKTVYLSINATFTGSVGAYGFIGARRTH